MTDILFNKLWKDALVQPDMEMYIAEYGYPEWFDEISPDITEIRKVLGIIHKTAHMSVRDIIRESGFTQSAFATRFCIPLRTVEDWATGKRKCADYDRLAFARQLGFFAAECADYDRPAFARQLGFFTAGKDAEHEQN